MILRRLARSVVPTHASRAYGAVPAVPEGRVSEFVVPEHLRQFVSLTLRMDAGRCMVIGKPRYQYPIAEVPAPKEVAPLLTAIRSCEARPFRIISYADEAGSVFNCSFFNDDGHMQTWLAWLTENALMPGSQFHDCMVNAVGDTDSLPTSETLLFGRGTKVLTDTRFGEYSVGMTVNFSRQTPLDEEKQAEMCDVFSSPEFEERIARCMLENNVTYFGRLAMLEDPDTTTDAPPALITALRYGTMDDAKRGTEAVRELMRPELTEWFGFQHASLLGTTTQVLEL